MTVIPAPDGSFVGLIAPTTPPGNNGRIIAGTGTGTVTAPDIVNATGAYAGVRAAADGSHAQARRFHLVHEHADVVGVILIAEAGFDGSTVAKTRAQTERTSSHFYDPSDAESGAKTAKCGLCLALRLQLFPDHRRPGAAMPTQDKHDDKRRNDARTSAKRNDAEPRVGDDDTPELENDQADSGPDRDHTQFGG